MAILKCKMCGGDVATAPDMTCGTCEHCGSAMTLPRLPDERRANLFNRANHFRRLNEFDKAISAYESILNEDNSDAEAHWGVVLSRYGIEYVEDPRTRERIPTCHRVQADSILRDPDYLLALEHADHGAKALYQAQASAIGEIQKGILALSAQEEPFDVFICYKETSDGGSRTRDSVLAQDIYHQLLQEKCRVFFSRITLENRIGQAYEPCIFAALNSAKVMVVVGTKPEHFTAVWVRNEWSRFLSLRRKDNRKLLIPCYLNMNPYDLPEELSQLQSQDMSKLGFLQDLVRGIMKTLGADKQPTGQSMPGASAAISEVTALVKRAMLFLEDGDWGSADKYAERALDKDPEYAEAYIAKLMVQLGVRTEVELGDVTESLTENSDYQKALRFSKAGVKQRLEGYNQKILEADERTRQENLERERREQQEREQRAIAARAERERQVAEEKAERERQANELARADQHLERGELNSAAEILASLERIPASVDYGEVKGRLQKLRGELDKLESTAKSTVSNLESLGAEVSKAHMNNPNPWKLRSRCRQAHSEANLCLQSLLTCSAKYPSSEWKVMLSTQKLAQAIRVFEVGAMSRLTRQVRIWSLVYIAAILIAGALITVTVVDRQREAKRIAAKAQVRAEAERVQAKAEAEEQERVQWAKTAEQKRWTNSLGQVFVPVLGTKTLFCIWDTRLKDYRAYAETVSVDEGWKQPRFEQDDMRPVVEVSWVSAKAFCSWLTKKDRVAGLLTSSQAYRLPTDAEWSLAVGLRNEVGNTPREKNGKIKDVYPWGTDWPPPKGAGNYGERLNVDNFRYTSPVGSFKANQYGLYDMGGNVWQWCDDFYNGKDGTRVLRGASWNFQDPVSLLSSYRNDFSPDGSFNVVGFRVVVASP